MKLAILDGTNLVHRAYYGVRPMSTGSGLRTNAVFGFFNILLKVLDDEKPDAVCVALDSAAPNFRVQKYDQYKAQREKMDDELREQFPLVNELLDACNVPRIAVEGYEADDIIGSYARAGADAGMQVAVITGDRDMLQLVSDKVRVKLVVTAMGQTVYTDYTPEKFFEDYGFPPERMVDLKALMGDSSDNIPGVAGVGKKTATDLIVRFGTLDGIYGDLDGIDVKPAVRRKLEAGREMARLSYELATIDCNMPLPVSLEGLVLKRDENGIVFDRAALYALCMKLEFRSFISRLGLSEECGEQPARVQAETKHDRLSPENWRRMLAELNGDTDEPAAVAWRSGLDALAVCCAEKTFIARERDFEESDYVTLLGEVFGRAVCVHGSKRLLHELESRGVAAEISDDVEIAAYLLDPSSGKYPIEKLALSRLKLDIPPSTAFERADTLDGTEEADRALALHAAAVHMIRGGLLEELKQQGMLDLYRSLELPLSGVLERMESAGILVDEDAIRKFGEMLSERIEQRQKEIYLYAGSEFNINSTKALGEVLFEKLGLPPVKKTRTGYSTDIEVLDKLRDRHPIIAEIIEFRQLTKLKSTYCEGLLKVIAPDGRIHTNFNMTATATGRLSSTEPNLQNIPVRTQLGSELRKMFVARPGCVLVDADYSQIELRVLAHIAGDRNMIDAFCSGKDIHTATAAQVFGISEHEVTAEQRRRAKAVNFGIVYGISDFSLAEDIGVSRAEAKSYIDSYFALYSGIHEYMLRTVERAKKDGFVTTILGRRRWIPEISAKNFNVRSFGERAAMNSPIQGSAADIIKLAMLRVDERLAREGMRSKLVLQVHDELIIEAPEDEAEHAAQLVREEMEGVMDLAAPLVADTSVGRSWYDAK